MIRGIVRSSNTKLHKLLGDYLLAARLQEGVRQAVCENMDSGTPEAFITLLDVIRKNDLIRYSSVKRAAATWTGIFDENSLERISTKILDEIYICLTDETIRKQNLESDDAIKLYCALWSFGFYDVKTAAEHMKRIISGGVKNRVLTASYYLRNIEWPAQQRLTSKYAVETYSEDQEIIACFMYSYMDGYSSLLYNAAYNSTGVRRCEDYKVRHHCDILKIFESSEEACRHYDILLNILKDLNKKQIEFSPCIFPWYSAVLRKTDIISRLCFIANALEDESKCDEICRYIPEIDVSNYGSRKVYILALLTDPKTDVQREMLLKLMSDREQSARKTAFGIIENVRLSDSEYEAAEQMLKYKTADIRTQISSLLYKQADDKLCISIERLASGKSEQLRTGALDLMITLSKDPKRADCFQKCRTYASLINNPTTKEKILLDSINDGGSDRDAENQKGFGLYNPEITYAPVKPDLDSDILKYREIFPDAAVAKSKAKALLKSIASAVTGTGSAEPDYYVCLRKLDQFIEQHKNDEFRAQFSSDMVLLGASTNLRRYSGKTFEESIALAHLWKEFYEKEIASFPLLLKMYIYLSCKTDLQQADFWNAEYTYLFGDAYFRKDCDFTYTRHLNTIVSKLFEEYYDEELMYSLSKVVMSYIAAEAPENKLIYHYKTRYGYSSSTIILQDNVISIFVSGLDMSYAVSHNSIKDAFDILLLIAQRYRKLEGKFSQTMMLSYSDFINAYISGLFPVDYLYKVMFEIKSPGDCLREMSMQYINQTKPFTPEFIKVRDEIYTKTTDMILSVELRRGDTQTQFSGLVFDIKRIFGIKKLAQILSALGNDTLNRSRFMTYYRSGSIVSKKDSLSHLLSVCAPCNSDNADKLRELIKNTDITDQRLIEAAMYNSLWMNIIGEYLGWKGFTSACYYFIAHMNESFDNETEAVIAKYTPLTKEELNGGAFDIKWFKDAYSELGEKRFDAVYKAAKYISDGSKHTRARKYADAVCGKLDADTLKKQITDKRNKDTLMAFSLIPLKSDDDLTDRYEFIQQFLKESKQFGSQRRASESAACSIALYNLASNAGFSDVTRLTMKMESRIVETRASQFEPVEIDDISVRINIDESGKPEIECIKNGKKLKSIPAKIKKNEYTELLKETLTILKNQYSRTRLMLEQSMEDRVSFSVDEIIQLSENPVINPLVKNLVYIYNNKPGFLSDGCLISCTEEKIKLKNSDEILIAHPLDLYKDGHWHEYQMYLFKNGIKQPFRQVFRELYVKTDDELQMNRSLRYAGNQIQPKKTVASLKSRRWVADYEDGLQKIFYKENIIASIYAMADWFSPSDIEAPTLEYVQFCDRKTFKPIEIQNVPDIIFSEVMRDVDMAVSVAHAGTVDPETSHSTVELRKAIVEFTLPMFKISNVTFEKNHAVIEGTRARYSVHLGSGVIHQFAGTQINVLPVHSQHRGKLFLPFVDEDPKTAEILSKIIMFAQDNKIKDPYILDQIH